MTQWRHQGFWSKFWYYTVLVGGALFIWYSGAMWLGDGGSSGRKRVFSTGFVVLCVIVAVIELILLNHFFGAKGR
ncbi:hypothetical protein K9857_23170 [Pseudomonas sp. REP124]|uniref:hypothetical protein n=1 Tax=Pseudomonas sp. REP124 TaxID=2875731 RepID=UPI001CCC22EC|nr:hypothetical protein [Pseudomonas sp. REP124]MBZ9784443.1 hypothetical protein [Pseudomonas sp. REP124]